MDSGTQLSGTVGCFVIMGWAQLQSRYLPLPGRPDLYSNISIKAVVDTNKLWVPTLNPKSAYENTSYIGGSYSMNIFALHLAGVGAAGGVLNPGFWGEYR